jgi:phospholipid/cholesterol/gamma-HCH transport system substrate-binding protein
MSKKASKTAIGGFVVGALALIVVGVLIFGSGKFLTKSQTYVMYFEGSVRGLNVGAPLVFRGVKIGSVTRIQLVANTDDLSFQIPVFVESERRHFTLTGDDTLDLSPEEQLALLVARGMRAQLIKQSMVTGQLIVELDFHPDKPAKLVAGYSEYMQIPTISSGMDDLMKQIEKAPIEDILNKVLSAVDGIEKAVNSKEVKGSLRSLEQTVKNLNKLVLNIDSRIEPLVSTVEETVKDYGKLARNVDRQVKPVLSGIVETERHANKLVKNVDAQVTRLGSSIDEAAKSAAAALVEAKKTLDTIEGLAGKDSQMIYQITTTLKELSAAARSIRVWADYLERHPEALLRGKGGS